MQKIKPPCPMHNSLIFFWYLERGSNPHGFRRGILSPKNYSIISIYKILTTKNINELHIHTYSWVRNDFQSQCPKIVPNFPPKYPTYQSGEKLFVLSAGCAGPLLSNKQFEAYNHGTGRFMLAERAKEPRHSISGPCNTPKRLPRASAHSLGVPTPNRARIRTPRLKPDTWIR